MPSRLEDYRSFLECALRWGYSIIPVEKFWELTVAGSRVPSGRYLILRHDVDTDPRTAERFWEIEQTLGVCGSYYFRLSTLHPRLMVKMAGSGVEVSYHYEELSTFVKRNGLMKAADIYARLPEIRAQFAKNIERLRKLTGLGMRVVAAHGDFVNRYLGIYNTLVLDDAELRRELAIRLEAYDDAYLRLLQRRLTDAGYPRYWATVSPQEAMQQQPVPEVIAVLVHPKHWHARAMANLRMDMWRGWEGLRYHVHSRMRACRQCQA